MSARMWWLKLIDSFAVRRSRMHPRVCWKTYLALVALSASLRAASVDYTRDVKPVLAEHCYRCHGASQQKSGLRLDTVSLALKGGERGSALKPGRSADSLIVQAVTASHPDLPRMPYKKPP